LLVCLACRDAASVPVLALCAQTPHGMCFTVHVGEAQVRYWRCIAGWVLALSPARPSPPLLIAE